MIFRDAPAFVLTKRKVIMDRQMLRKKYAQGGICDGTEVEWKKPEPPKELLDLLASGADLSVAPAPSSVATDKDSKSKKRDKKAKREEKKNKKGRKEEPPKVSEVKEVKKKKGGEANCPFCGGEFLDVQAHLGQCPVLCG
eukprot:TRINITY_DN1406_c0_g1_i2.p2 TRINITY_DN1406_c0_g1~~TRINITY_DN1406_c0_g1_i2.p2  ORF type:complete len:140 (-),score=36.92 TRINITY_DN1406_c0_g1_i2:114-533(-)